MAELLADDAVKGGKDLEAVFATFHEVRKERGEFLVQTSRRIGDVYEWRAEGVGSDFAKMEEEINWRNAALGDVNVGEMCQSARSNLQSKLSAQQGKL